MILNYDEVPEDYKWDGTLNINPNPNLFLPGKRGDAAMGTVTVIITEEEE